MRSPIFSLRYLLASFLLTAGCALPLPPTVQWQPMEINHLTPRTKGETLLQIAVVWPVEARPLASMQFDAKLFLDRVPAGQVISDSKGRFNLSGLPAGSQLRIEAQARSNRHLMFKTQFKLPMASASVKEELSLEHTAAVALLDYAEKMASPLSQWDAKRLMMPDTLPFIQDITSSMMPYFTQELDQELETMPAVLSALDTARTQLEARQHLLH